MQANERNPNGYQMWQCPSDDVHIAHAHRHRRGMWWCEGLEALTPPELPVETEMVYGAWYGSDNAGVVPMRYRGVLDGGFSIRPWRLAPVARYEPSKPETPEPKGLGAVVRDARSKPWVRGPNGWLLARNGDDIADRKWEMLAQPVEILSPGVEI